MSLVAILRPLSRALANSGCEPMLMISSAVSTRGPVSFAPFFSSTTNSTSIDVSIPVPVGSPSAWRAWPSPTNSRPPG